jgi:L-threonylcarbamoyladenylate synthase
MSVERAASTFRNNARIFVADQTGASSLMRTERIAVDPITPDASAVEYAARLLADGRLVALPTETVYGLAAHALRPDAVDKIYRAKGRPSFNPVIVHVEGMTDARSLTLDWSPRAEVMAERFWPGPLTLVLPSDPSRVPAIVTAGGPTVAVRAPSHPVMRAVLTAAGFPLAAPSANLSEAISPTTAEHVLASLEGRIDLVLDAGRTPQGIESTVLDPLTGEILRPGPIERSVIEAILGPPRGPTRTDVPIRSPGQFPRHYAPRARLIVTSDPRDLLAREEQEGKRIVWLSYGPEQCDAAGVEIIELPTLAADYRSQLYASLHQADALLPDLIVVTRPPDGPEWEGVHDRLRRASAE